MLKVIRGRKAKAVVLYLLVFVMLLILIKYQIYNLYDPIGEISKRRDFPAFSTIKDISSSRYECVAKGTNAAYCQGTNVCISRRLNIFLIDQSFPKSGNWSKYSFPWHGKKVDNETMAANLVMAEPNADVWFKPGMLSFGREKGSIEISARTPVKFHSNGLLLLQKGYSSYHLSHLLFNVILPIFNIIYGKGVENILYRDYLSRTNASLLESVKRTNETWRDVFNNLKLRATQKPEIDPFFAQSDQLSGMDHFILIQKESFFLPLESLFDSAFVADVLQENSKNDISSADTKLMLNGRELEMDEIHCFARASFGPAGINGITRDPLSFDEILPHFRNRISNSLETLPTGKSDSLSSPILKEYSLNGTGEIRKTINITFLNRPFQSRSIRNGDDIFEKMRLHIESSKPLYPNIQIHLMLTEFSKATLKAQIYQMLNTNMFITMHGNAMGYYTLMPFAEHAASIIEIQPPDFGSDWFSFNLQPWLSLRHPNRHLYQSYSCQERENCTIPEEMERNYKSRDFLVEWDKFQPIFAKGFEVVCRQEI